MTQPLLKMSQVNKVYPQGKTQVHALRNMDLEVQPGEFTAICGPSGSGKTTALNLMGALDKPTSGTVTLEGQALQTMSRRQLSVLRRDRIGFVFQAYNLLPVLTAFENAEIVLAMQGVDARERRERVMGLLGQVGLQGMEHRKPTELSGGQQQRVAIARAMAAHPAVVLADEPTANLDSDTAGRLLDLMSQLNKDQGVTFVFSTHDTRVMERAHRLVHMVDGAVAQDERH